MILPGEIYGYARISVDEDSNKDNTSIENQCAIISDYVKRRFPGMKLTLFKDRDRSGYTFEQREDYQKMRLGLMSGKSSILIVKDFSRFARRNSRGLVELEDLRDAGVRIISIGDNIDYPTEDEWLQIQLRFLLNEMPVTDASKKVRSIVTYRQQTGDWICAVPYGYSVKNWAKPIIELDEEAADVVRKIFDLYLEGYGYKRIADWLTQQSIATPRALENAQRLAAGETVKRVAKNEWSIATIQSLLSNDFYIGTLRQRKYQRVKINGATRKTEDSEHLVFLNHHPAIIEDRVFLKTQEQLKLRTTNNYRGIRKYPNTYTGLLHCGDCGAPMFSMSRNNLKLAYTCGTYHRHGTTACSSHHIRVDKLDELVKLYIREVKKHSSKMLKKLEKVLDDDPQAAEQSRNVVELLEREYDSVKLQLKSTKAQKIRELTQHPERADSLCEIYGEMEDELERRMDGLKNQLEMSIQKNNTIVSVTRTAKTVLSVFDSILKKPSLDKPDIELIVDGILIYEDHIDVQLKADIDMLLHCDELPEDAVAAMAEIPQKANFEQGIVNSLQTQLIQRSQKRLDKVYDVNVISNGDPLEIYTDKEGGVIFRKYSLMGGLSDFAGQFCETMSKQTGGIAVITDRDVCISVAGGGKKELTDKRVSGELEQIMEARQVYQRKGGSPALPLSEDSDRFFLTAAAPILSGGDVLGCVAFVSEGDVIPDEGCLESKIAQTVSGFLGRHMEG
ncbi:MAG: stage V sporulation T C-terminal domain-containing protein [Oscillospiraceae bacterium]